MKITSIYPLAISALLATYPAMICAEPLPNACHLLDEPIAMRILKSDALATGKPSGATVALNSEQRSFDAKTEKISAACVRATVAGLRSKTFLAINLSEPLAREDNESKLRKLIQDSRSLPDGPLKPLKPDPSFDGNVFWTSTNAAGLNMSVLTGVKGSIEVQISISTEDPKGLPQVDLDTMRALMRRALERI